MEKVQNEGLCALCNIAKRRTEDTEKKYRLTLSEDDLKGIAQAAEHHAGALFRERISHSKFRQLIKEAILNHVQK